MSNDFRQFVGIDGQPFLVNLSHVDRVLRAIVRCDSSDAGAIPNYANDRLSVPEHRWHRFVEDQSTLMMSTGKNVRVLGSLEDVQRIVEAKCDV